MSGDGEARLSTRLLGAESGVRGRVVVLYEGLRVVGYVRPMMPGVGVQTYEAGSCFFVVPVSFV